MVEANHNGALAEYRRTIRLDLTPLECLELALWLERAGLEFYRMLAEETPEGRLRDFYLRLSGMEIKHEGTIRGLIKQVSSSASPKLPFDETLTNREFFLRLKTFSENKTFPHDFSFLVQLEEFKEPKEALALALEIETKAIGLYRTLSEFKLSVPAEAVLRVLALEEEKHFAEIKAILRSL